MHFFQVALLIPGVYVIPYPAVYLGLLDAMQFVNINVVEIFHFSCISSWNFHDTLLFVTIAPVAILAFAWGVVVIGARLVVAPERYQLIKKQVLGYSIIFLWCIYPVRILLFPVLWGK